jgi:hypothetical protein
MALAAVAVCTLVLPAGISSDNTGLYRPILIGMYVPAIPFFIALYQGYNLLTYIDHNKAFSQLSVTALKKIKYYGIVISALYAAGMPFIFNAADKDDAPGAILIGLVFMFAPLVIAVFAAVLQKLLQNAIDIKSENDLTV